MWQLFPLVGSQVGPDVGQRLHPEVGGGQAGKAAEGSAEEEAGADRAGRDQEDDPGDQGGHWEDQEGLPIFQKKS